ncbi:MAG: MurR/RpiR family transcriptional regulator [Puniceicoccaceae bacterium]
MDSSVRSKGSGPDNGAEALGNLTFPMRLNLLRNSLTEAEARVGDYFQRHPEAVYLSITEAAQEGGLGYGTIIRFCQKIGCTGFQDFKVLLAQELRDAKERKPTDRHTPLEGNIQKLQSDILNTAKLIDPGTMEKVARCLAKAHFVLAAGIAGSASLAHGLNYRLSRVGIYSAADCEGYTMAIRAATMKKGDVFFGMSFSGATKDLVNAARIAKEQGALVVALTAFIKSPLGEVADYTLVGASDRDPFSCEIFPNSPRDFILDLLVTEICGIRPGALETVQDTFEAISDRRI